MTGPEKWAFLNDSLDADANDETIRRIARALVELAGGRPLWIAKLAMAVARDGVEYLTDHDRAGGQAFDPAADTWSRGIDACHGKARLFVALCRAAGLPARLEPVWAKSDDPAAPALVHVFGAVNLSGAWIPAEVTASRARLGEKLANIPKEANGKWAK